MGQSWQCSELASLRGRAARSSARRPPRPALLEITDGGSYELFSVTCQDMDNSVLSEVTVGDPITVLRNFDHGGDLGVDLKDCTVVE